MFNDLAKAILEGKFLIAKQVFFEALDLTANDILEDQKKWIQAETILGDVKGLIDEARFKIVPVRIRRGKIQRRKKVATIKGYTIRGGKLTKMAPKETRNRKMAQRRGKIKRKSKQSRSLAKRKRSMRRLAAMGGGK